MMTLSAVTSAYMLNYQRRILRAVPSHPKRRQSRWSDHDHQEPATSDTAPITRRDRRRHALPQPLSHRARGETAAEA
jgi:hypothetical protein